MIVGHTLVDASSRTASVLMVNPNAEEVVLPSFTCVGKLVAVSAISVALADPGLPNEEHATLPEHLEEIIAGSHPSLAVQQQKRLFDQRAVRRLFAVCDWVMRYYPAAKKCKLDSVWVGPSLVVSIVGWVVGIQKHPDSLILLIHCQDVKKVPQPSGMRSWITPPQPVGAPPVPVLGASTVAHTSRGSPHVDVLPDEGVVLADLDSAGMQFALGSQVAGRSWMDVDGTQMGCVVELCLRRAFLSRPLFFGLMGCVSYTHLRCTSWMRALFG